MKITRFGKNAQQLTFGVGLSNCYLVRESDGITLIDTGPSGHGEEIMMAARDFATQICRIVLTHSHADTIGSLDELVHLMGKVDVAISHREAALLRGDQSLLETEPQKKLQGNFASAKSRPTHHLGDGELFGSLRCISTPGHTPGHMSFLDERDGNLYSGDALQSVGKLSVIPDAPWYFPTAKMATWDEDLALHSAQLLDDMRPRQIGTAHGPIVDRGSALHRAVSDAVPATRRPQTA